MNIQDTTMLGEILCCFLYSGQKMPEKCCACCCKRHACNHFFKTEFDTKNFGLHHERHEFFITAQCGHAKIYPVWTVVAVLYHITAVIYDAYKTRDSAGKASANYFLYIHNWSYLLLTVYAIVDCISTLYVHCHMKHLLKRHEVNHTEIGVSLRNKDVKFSYKTIGEIYRIQWYMKVTWALFTTSSVVGITVSVIYWTLYIFDGIVDFEAKLLHEKVFEFDSLAFYAVNSIMILFHVLMSAKPFRLLHFYMPLLFVTVYILFTTIHYGVSHDGIYTVFNWEDTFITAGKTVLVLYFLVPIIHLLVYLVIQLRILIGRRLHLRYSVSRWKKVNKIQAMQNTAF